MSQTKRSHHGNTPAAWTTVTLVFIAFCVSGTAVWVGNAVMFWVGVVISVVGAVVGKLMQMAGLGQTRRS
ncbi:MAG: hypothetical protein RL441_247 [Actinomycetota bacterium]|jgi:hypothetical protein